MTFEFPQTNSRPSYTEEPAAMSFDDDFRLTAEEMAKREEARAKTEAEFALTWQINTVLRDESKRLEKHENLMVNAASAILMNKVMADPYYFIPQPGKVSHISEAPSYVEPEVATSSATTQRQAQ